ncbi:hypothetical protein VIGAN_11124600 [Vigna angularis var. angularis]|uniref:Uncharacterized protein n=1 Tax=Vigna angularis var. angularis TaxID=157739 RepID=A0A0S3T9K1_PHAAN|nr:hypothetical protein VIGAN_11124600 [Vigna angularis var. angularis]
MCRDITGCRLPGDRHHPANVTDCRLPVFPSPSHTQPEWLWHFGRRSVKLRFSSSESCAVSTWCVHVTRWPQKASWTVWFGATAKEMRYEEGERESVSRRHAVPGAWFAALRTSFPPTLNPPSWTSKSAPEPGTSTLSAEGVALVLCKFVSSSNSDDSRFDPDCDFAAEVFDAVLERLVELKEWFEVKILYHLCSGVLFWCSVLVYEKEKGNNNE